MILSIVLIIVLVAVIFMAGRNIFLWKEGTIVVQHRFIYEQIERYVEIQHKIPVNLNEVSDLKQLLSKTKVYYNPDAWQHGERILLRTPLWFSNIVTFGNMSHATMSRWRSAGRKNSSE